MDISWSRLSAHLTKKAMNKGIPLSLSFELTARCNQKCNMCYVSLPANDKEAKSKELSAEQWISLGREARDAGMLILTLTGGEVFLRDDFRTIYEGLLDLGLLIQINTNGTLINEQTIDWLKGIAPNRVHITLYGASPETCTRVTGMTNSYSKTVWAIDALSKAGIPVEVRTTVVKDNCHEYKEFVDFAQERNHNLGVVNYISPRREGVNSKPKENRLSADDLVDFEINITKYGSDQKEETEVSFKDSASVKDTEEDANEFYERYPAFPCTAGKSSGWITWDGRLLACGLLSQLQAYPLEVGFNKAWQDLQNQCAQVPACVECGQCQYNRLCMYCPARLINETGSFDRGAPYLCAAAIKRFNYVSNYR